MEANDELDARSYVKFIRTGGLDKHKGNSQLFARQDRFEENILELLRSGDISEAIVRLDYLVKLSAGDERILDSVGVKTIESIFHCGLASDSLLRQLEARVHRPGWDVVISCTAVDWAQERVRPLRPRMNGSAPKARRRPERLPKRR